MNTDWIKFESINKRQVDRITVTKSEAIGFPTKFFKDNNIASFNYVVLFFNASQKAIGILFTNDTNEKSKFKIIKSVGYGGNIIARSFFRVNRIDTKIYHGHYEYEKINLPNIGEIFVIKLKERSVEPNK